MPLKNQFGKKAIYAKTSEKLVHCHVPLIIKEGIIAGGGGGGTTIQRVVGRDFPVFLFKVKRGDFLDFPFFCTVLFI
jgi:hypothetical protein